MIDVSENLRIWSRHILVGGLTLLGPLSILGGPVYSQDSRGESAGCGWLIPLTQVTPYPPSPRPSGLAVATDAQLHGRRSHPEPRRFLAVSGGPIACQARCGGHLS